MIVRFGFGFGDIEQVGKKWGYDLIRARFTMTMSVYSVAMDG